MNKLAMQIVGIIVGFVVTVASGYAVWMLSRIPELQDRALNRVDTTVEGVRSSLNALTSRVERIDEKLSSGITASIQFNKETIEKIEAKLIDVEQRLRALEAK